MSVTLGKYRAFFVFVGNCGKWWNTNRTNQLNMTNLIPEWNKWSRSESFTWSYLINVNAICKSSYKSFQSAKQFLVKWTMFVHWQTTILGTEERIMSCNEFVRVWTGVRMGSVFKSNSPPTQYKQPQYCRKGSNSARLNVTKYHSLTCKNYCVFPYLRCNV